MPRPSVSRMVHYVSRGSADGAFKPECRAAVIAAAPVNGRGRPTTKVDLVVLNPGGIFFDTCLQDEDTKAGGTWHWPEIVEDTPAPAKKAAKKAPAKASGATAKE